MLKTTELIRKCNNCGKKFYLQPEWVYKTIKRPSTANAKWDVKYYCSYSCLCTKKSGKLSILDRKSNEKALKDFKAIHKELMSELEKCTDLDKADQLQDDLQDIEDRINILERSLEKE